MDWIEIVFGALLVIVSILLVICVVMQEPKQSGLQGLNGSSESFLSKNKGKTLDAKLSKVTGILSVAFFALVFLINIAITYIK